jgi:regulator of sigma E protease
MDPVAIFNFLLLALGFGFVIFWHELGHFLAAKWAGVRVEQFAVGFGNAAISYRQGLGVRRGSSVPEYERLKASDPAAAKDVSPTEYRLNWLPLGGYVKMLGQEDLVVDDATDAPPPDSYLAKTVGQRMVIISAGVVMNVLLAAVLFTGLYFVGFGAAAAKVGFVAPGSPAERAGLQVGDEVREINGGTIHDFDKLRLGVALLKPDEDAQFTILRDGEEQTIPVRPDAMAGAAGMLGIGVAPTPMLHVPDELQIVAGEADLEEMQALSLPDVLAVLPGQRVIEVDNRAVGPGDYAVYHRALQEAGEAGRTVTLLIEEPSGDGEAPMTRRERVRPELIGVGNDVDAVGTFGGLRPLLEVRQVLPDSNMRPGGEREAAGKDVIKPGDVLLALRVPATGDLLPRPTREELANWLQRVGDGTVDLRVQRDGEAVWLRDLPLTGRDGGLVSRLAGNTTYGLGVMIRDHLGGTGLAAGVRPQTPVAASELKDLIADPAVTSARIASVGDVEVATLYDVSRELRSRVGTTGGDVSIAVEVETAAGTEVRETTLTFDEAAAAATAVTWTNPVLALTPTSVNAVEAIRKTRNPLRAMYWGVFETRDQILNLYLTLRRVIFDQTVSARNLSGPVGILHSGTIIAARGYDWLIWFLAMLSANLAVVNFLPIPILDGGHMVFLLWEKIRGRAPSRRVQELALWAGLAFLGVFVLFVTYNDLTRLVSL